MNWKEIMVNIIVVMVALALFNMLAKKVPMLKGSYEADEYESDSE